VARTCGRSTIDFAGLGNRWLLYEQLDHATGVEGVERLGQGGRLVVSAGEVTSAVDSPWMPDGRAGTVDEAVHMLSQSIACSRDGGATPSLGLSGGFDSRVILSFLATHHKGRFSAHTFGQPDDPDVRIASRIAGTLNFPHAVFGDISPDVGTCIQQAEAFVAHTAFAEVCTVSLRRQPFPLMHERGHVIIDGGLGELSRRQYHKKILRSAIPELMRKDAQGIARHLRMPGPPLFTRDVLEVMEKGLRDSAQKVIDRMPETQGMGPGNWLDLFAVRTSVPNMAGPEQSRVDHEIVNYMPFVQPSYLQAVFSLPMEKRESGAWLAQSLRDRCPSLAGFPLVKFGTTHPYGFSKYPAWLWAKTSSRIFGQYVDGFPDAVLLHLKEYVQDRLHSRSAIETPELDRAVVENAVRRFYGPDRTHGETVRWWLTYVMWKEGIQKSEVRSQKGGAIR
jgi:hypothetical protein